MYPAQSNSWPSNLDLGERTAEGRATLGRHARIRAEAEQRHLLASLQPTTSRGAIRRVDIPRALEHWRAALTNWRSTQQQVTHRVLARFFDLGPRHTPVQRPVRHSGRGGRSLSARDAFSITTKAVQDEGIGRTTPTLR